MPEKVETGKAIVGGEDFQTRFGVTEMLCQGLWAGGKQWKVSDKGKVGTGRVSLYPWGSHLQRLLLRANLLHWGSLGVGMSRRMAVSVHFQLFSLEDPLSSTSASNSDFSPEPHFCCLPNIQFYTDG